MAESTGKKTAKSDSTEVKTDVDAKVNTGDITYEDHGTYIVEIDNRGPEEVRRQLPKSLKDVPVDQATHDQVEERIEIEKAAVENEGGDPESVTLTAPPVENPDPNAEPETVTVTAKGAE